MKDIILDTGFDENANNLNFDVKVELEPRTRYYWQVSVRTDLGEENTSEIQWFETGKMNEEWVGKWITCNREELRHPYFQKNITPRKEISKARLYVSGLGLYEPYYNDVKIGDEYLTPYSNNYNQWVQYQTYDITENLKEKGNLSILLGNGWYKGRFGFSQREEKGFYGDQWKLIAEVVIDYTDGTTEVVGTDESWVVKRSKITYSSLYDGEHIDDTLEELPTEEALMCEPPKGTLMARLSLPVIEHEVFEPIELIDTPLGEKVFDLGQNFSGIFILKVKEPKGTKIHIQTGEILQNGNFYNDNLRSAKSEYIYISNGEEATIKPHFTYYGYRYVKISGVTNLKKEDFKGIALYSDIEEVGEVKTGHDLVNKLISNVRWGLKGNFLDVPTDCPQRDERMGWTGDAQVFTNTATYLTDTYAFYNKYLFDMYQEQKVANGKVPDVVPSVGVETTAAVWGDASCIIPWNLYTFYGDKNILIDQYESMKSWVEYVKSIDGDTHQWREHKHYGDWLALDHPQMNDEQVLGGTDEGYIANIYYAQSIEILGKSARVLGYIEDAEKYKELAEIEFENVRKEYFSETGRCCINTQTGLTLALKHNISNNKEILVEQLKKLFKDNNYKLKTGFVGTPIISNVLSENGLNDLAYNLLLTEEFPGWLREVKLGATTVWERWNSVLDNGLISGTGMNSLNHYAYGSILEWIFRWSAGLNVKENNVGCREIDITPVLNWKLGKVEAEYNSPMGIYKSGWEILDINKVIINVTIPFGCVGKLSIPLIKDSQFEDTNNEIFNNVKNGVCYLETGSYSLTYETSQALKEIFNTDTPIRIIKNNANIVNSLAQILPLNRIPSNYDDLTIKQVAVKFGGQLSEEKIEALDKILEKF